VKLEMDFKAFRFSQFPPATNRPSRKLSTQPALSSSKFNVNFQIKQIAHTAKMTVSLRVPNDKGYFDPPEPQLEV